MKTVMPVKATIEEINKVIAKIHPGSVIPIKGEALKGVKVAASLLVQIIKDYVPEPELIALVGETPEIAEMRKKIQELDDQAEAAAAAEYEKTKSYMKAHEATKTFSAQAGELRKKIEDALKVDVAVERLISETIGKTELEVTIDVIAWRQEVNRTKEKFGGNGTVVLVPVEESVKPFEKVPAMSLALFVQKDESKKVLTYVGALPLKNDKGEVKSLSAFGHEISEKIFDNPGINNGVNDTAKWDQKLDEFKLVFPKVEPAKEEAPAEPATEPALPVAA